MSAAGAGACRPAQSGWDWLVASTMLPFWNILRRPTQYFCSADTHPLSRTNRLSCAKRVVLVGTAFKEFRQALGLR